MKFHSAALFETDHDPHCHFGITEGLAVALAGGLTAGLGVEAGTAGVLGSIGSGALIGAGGGAALSGLTGGDPLTGALTGGLTGGAIGLGPTLGAATGIGTTAADVGLGAAGGAIGSAITGQNPLTGALGGGAAGFGAGVLGGSGSSTPAASTSIAPSSASGTGAGSSAAAQAGPGAPTPVGGANPVDLTASPSATFGLTDPNGNPFASTGGAASTGAATGVAGGTAAATGSGGAFGNIGTNIMGLVEKNPGILLAGGLLGANMLLGDKPLPAEAAIQQQAGEAGTHAATLAAYQQSGTLPTGLQSVVDQQFDAAKGAVVSQYSQMGLGNSTMLTDKLNQLKAQKSAEIAQFADNLAKQGVQWANLSAQEFGTLLNAQAQQDAAFTASLGSFAGGLAGLRTKA